MGERVTRLRIARGLSQTDLAEQLGIAQNVMSDLERGRTRLNADTVIRLTKTLNVTADEVLGLDSRRLRNVMISHDVLRRTAKLEALPPAMKKHVLRTIDMLLKAAGT